MRVCPNCQSIYTDDSLVYCLQDGGKLKVSSKNKSQMETEEFPADFGVNDPTIEATKINGLNVVNNERAEVRKTLSRPSLKMVLSSIIFFSLGGLFFVSVYKLTFTQADVGRNESKISEMRTDNLEFSSFEKNRRNVDADPEAYLREVPPADDAEDYYLIGRANILKGDFQNARMNLVEAQKRVLASPATNTKILATDISLALMIANDAAIQPRLKTQIESTLNPQSLSGANSNR